MENLAREQIGDRREPDMGMRPHIHAAAGSKIRRSHVIEKDEGPDHASRGGRQDAVDLEAADVAAPSFDQPFDHRPTSVPLKGSAVLCAPGPWPVFERCEIPSRAR